LSVRLRRVWIRSNEFARIWLSIAYEDWKCIEFWVCFCASLSCCRLSSERRWPTFLSLFAVVR
jgi:hypothetical protein